MQNQNEILQKMEEMHKEIEELRQNVGTQRAVSGKRVSRRSRLLGFITAFLFVGGIMLFAATVNVPHSFTSGQVISAGAMNSNFNALRDAINTTDTEITANDTDITGLQTDVTAVSNLIHATVPAGVILMWSGDAATIPTGWALCDGSSGTPNLTNRFVVGAGGSYTANDTGGTADSSHTHGTDSKLGTISLSHSHTVNEHAHIIFSGWSSELSPTYMYDSGGNQISVPSQAFEPSSYWFIEVGGPGWHQSGETYINRPMGTSKRSPGTDSKLSDYSASHSHTTTSQIGATDNRPPYYALCFIMKL